MDNRQNLEEDKNSLKARYLVAFVITRSAMWAKAPYLYTLFMTVQKFVVPLRTNRH